MWDEPKECGSSSGGRCCCLLACQPTSLLPLPPPSVAEHLLAKRQKTGCLSLGFHGLLPACMPEWLASCCTSILFGSPSRRGEGRTAEKGCFTSFGFNEKITWIYHFMIHRKLKFLCLICHLRFISVFPFWQGWAVKGCWIPRTTHTHTCMGVLVFIPIYFYKYVLLLTDFFGCCFFISPSN